MVLGRFLFGFHCGETPFFDETKLGYCFVVLKQLQVSAFTVRYPECAVYFRPAIKPIFQSIAAHVDKEACCDWVGEDGAGHFVKMVHNGIEYGDMQLIAEAYHILRDVVGVKNDEMSEVCRLEFNDCPIVDKRQLVLVVTQRNFSLHSNCRGSLECFGRLMVSKSVHIVNLGYFHSIFERR